MARLALLARIPNENINKDDDEDDEDDGTDGNTNGDGDGAIGRVVGWIVDIAQKKSAERRIPI